ncbi:hypothetical protein F4808DRAFT_128042 [Astrocystis sublimbata]|nr:hypothetical protein F4808DRAFT_128042 [Astrocystis sublimbata]
MPGNTNPLFVPAEHNEKANTDVEARLRNDSGDTSPSPDVTSTKSENHAGTHSPTDHLTRRQFIYIFILDGLISGLVGAGLNTGIAYATYHNEAVVHLFALPNSLATDCASTLVSQFVITWFVQLYKVPFHIRKGMVEPIGFLREPKNKFLRWYFCLPDDQPQKLTGVMHWFWLVWGNFIRSLILLLPFFPIVFGASIGFLILAGTKVGNDWFFNVLWGPQIFKAVYGIVVGTTCTPLMSAYFIVRSGWVMKARGTSETQPVEDAPSQ